MTDFDTKDAATFLSDFASVVTASTWGTTFRAIFDEERVGFEGNSGVQPHLLIASSDLPASYSEGDLFTFSNPITGVQTTYKLVDVEHDQPGYDRIVLALP